MRGQLPRLIYATPRFVMRCDSPKPLDKEKKTPVIKPIFSDQVLVETEE